MPNLHRPGQRTWLVLVAFAVALAAACGPSDPALTTQEDPDRALADCIDQAGEDPSMENVDQRRVEDPEYDSVVRDCAASLDLPLLDAGEVTRSFDERTLAIVACMTDRGWDLPEPVRGEDGGYILDGLSDNVPVEEREDFWAEVDQCSTETSSSTTSSG